MNRRLFAATFALTATAVSLTSVGTSSASGNRRPQVATPVGIVEMLVDINPGGPSSYARVGVELPNGLLLAADGGGNTGTELWITDGTASGTSLVKDIRTGSSSSYPGNFKRLGDKALFVADDGVTGIELWITDGTTAGTTLVKDMYTGSSFGQPEGSYPHNFIEFAGKIVFSAADNTGGMELWVTDGTTAGTTRVKDINPGTSPSSPDYFAVVGGKLVFRANDPTTGTELWSSDGTESGTTLLKDINPTLISGYPLDGNPVYMTAMGGKVYFNGSDGINGSELWVTDGTAAGTTMLKDIYTGSNGGNPNASYPQNLTAMGNRVFFSAQDGTNGSELWVTDGTAAGTTLVSDIYTGTYGSGYPNSSNPNSLTVIGDKLYFAAQTSSGREPWVSDGTVTGTYTLGDISPGASGAFDGGIGPGLSAESMFTAYGNRVLFAANVPNTYGIEPWITDGTAAGTSLLYDIRSGGSNGMYSMQFQLSSGGGFFYVYKGRALFAGDTGSNGFELWSLASLPTAPRNVTVSATSTSAVVAWQAPSFTGPGAISSYTATSNPGNFTCTTTALTCQVDGLLSNQDYTFTVVATSFVGNSPASVASTRVRTPSPQLGSLVGSLTDVTDIVSGSQVTPGQSLTVLYRGFNPGEIVLLMIASNPVVIGSANADANGNVAISGTVPIGTEAGAHHVILYAPVSGFGAQQSVNVTAASAGSASGSSANTTTDSTVLDPATLPATGANNAMAVSALFVLVTGLLALRVRRRTLPVRGYRPG